MIRMIHCKKLDQDLEALDFVPYPGELGQRIYHEISKQAWQLWLSHQTMLINEYRLNMINPQDRNFLQQEMEKFFFGSGSEKPVGFVPKE